MKTNFFTQVQPLLESGMDLTISVKLIDGKMIVATRPNYDQVKDKAINQLKPLVLTHQVDDLDENYFETITAPMQTFLSNVEIIKAYEDSIKSTTSKKVDSVKSKQASQTDKDQQKAGEYLTDAKEFIKQEKFIQALSRLDKAKELDKSVEGVDQLIEETKELVIKPSIDNARAFESSFNFKEALKELSTVRKLDPQNEQVGEIDQKIISKVGDTVFNQLKNSIK